MTSTIQTTVTRGFGPKGFTNLWLKNKSYFFHTKVWEKFGMTKDQLERGGVITFDYEETDKGFRVTAVHGYSAPSKRTKPTQKPFRLLEGREYGMRAIKVDLETGAIEWLITHFVRGDELIPVPDTPERLTACSIADECALLMAYAVEIMMDQRLFDGRVSRIDSGKVFVEIIDLQKELEQIEQTDNVVSFPQSAG